MKIIDIFLNLKGIWIYKRALINSVNEPLGSVEGKAIFTKIQHNILYYKEEGEFKNPRGQKNNIFREYLYFYNQDKDEIEKHFSVEQNDSGLFYGLTFKASEENAKVVCAIGSHPCKQDIYQAQYEFMVENAMNNKLSLSQFKLVYKVTGPEKNYSSLTEFSVS